MIHFRNGFHRAIMRRRKSRIRPVDDATSHILSSGDKQGLTQNVIDDYKGRGVFATQRFEKGDFVLEYRGEIISFEECQSKNIDASREDGSLGRLANDDHKSPNCVMKKVLVNDRVHLCLFAVRNIEPGTEIVYNYGDSKWPWRKKENLEDANVVSDEPKLFPDHVTTQENLEDANVVSDEPKLFPDHVTTQENLEDANVVSDEPKLFPDHVTTQENLEDANVVSDEPKLFPDHVTTQENLEDANVVSDEPKLFPDHVTTQENLEDANVVSDEPKLFPDHVTTQENLEDANVVSDEPKLFPDHVTTQENLEDANVVSDEPKLFPDHVTTQENLEDVVSDEPKLFPDHVTTQENLEDANVVSDEPKLFPDHVTTQVFSVRGISLVDYSDSDETSSDCWKDQPLTPHIDEVKEKLNETRKIPMDSVPDYWSPLHDSCESVVDESEAVEESSDVDPLKDNSKDEDVVPKLWRTDSSLNQVLDFSDDTSDDSAPDSTFKAAQRQRPRRACRHAIQKSVLESDDSSADSGEEYLPNPKDEGTDSDRSSDLQTSKHSKVQSSKQNRVMFSSQSSFASSSKNSFSSSSYSQSEQSEASQSQFESSHTQFRSSEINRGFETSHESSQSVDDDKGDVNEDVVHTNNEVSSSVPLEEVFVEPVLKKVGGTRCYNKKHHCLFCGKEVQKMSRHLLRKHSDDVEVAKAFTLPKKSKERRLQLDHIRNKGNYEHNMEVIESQKGKLIPSKQPTEKTEGADFLHCVHCYGLFKRKALWRHFKVCKFQPETSKPGRKRVQALCAFAEPTPTRFPRGYWMLLKGMNQDKIAMAVKQDHFILEFGYRLFKKNGKVKSQHQYIRQRLRELGRLALEAKKSAPTKTIKELIKPEMYDNLVTAAKCIAGFSDDTGDYRCASLARKLGHTLHGFAMFVKSQGLKMKEEMTVKNAEEFIQLYQDSWKYDIGSQALTQLNQAKWNAPQLLPLTQDVQTLHFDLSEKQQKSLNALKEETSSSNWKDLAKVTLAQLIIFNRRREGEVSRTLLSAYLLKDVSETQEDVNLALTPLEQKLCKHFSRMTIVGKRGRKVPLLLTPIMRESLDLLVEKREECGVLKENVFLFALPQSENSLRGYNCLKELVEDCDGINNPTALTSTKLRKHIATMSTVLNLQNTELDQLADFLGHNIDVHRKHYRLPEGTLQIAKISKILLALEQGRLGEYKGKNLDEIHIDVNGITLYWI
ncbi:N-lysine methyltransferase KMT5A-A [Merluccius polli]|uniref:N-lysine methyltransferase KMT5A-A n=1 Tax=Merluccius polli TaxID=89951 RepID=A0AA47MQ28_MERPO|nr:N-lysine methyltransferase KMT5A-A [Merluccius polli]